MFLSRDGRLGNVPYQFTLHWEYWIYCWCLVGWSAVFCLPIATDTKAHVDLKRHIYITRVWTTAKINNWQEELSWLKPMQEGWSHHKTWEHHFSESSFMISWLAAKSSARFSPCIIPSQLERLSDYSCPPTENKQLTAFCPILALQS